MRMRIGQEFEACGQAESGEQEQGQAEEEVTSRKTRNPNTEVRNRREGSKYPKFRTPLQAAV